MLNIRMMWYILKIFVILVVIILFINQVNSVYKYIDDDKDWYIIFSLKLKDE